MKKIYFDTETSGLRPGQIGQLSVIMEDDGDVSAKNYFFKIDSIEEGAEKLLGRGVAFYDKYSHGVRFGDKAQEVFELFKSRVLVAHNEQFDENFLSTELWRSGIMLVPVDRFDTMAYFKPILRIPSARHGWKNPKLEEVVKFLRIDEDKAKKYCKMLFKDDSYDAEADEVDYHDARLDTTMMFLAMQIQLEKLRSEGKSPWQDTFCVKG